MLPSHLASCATHGGITRVKWSHHSKPEYNFVLFRCGKPECEQCRNIKRARLVRRLRAAQWPKRIVFWTITTDPNILSPGEALQTLTHRWHLLCRNLIRVYPGVQFFRVLEFTESGLPHLHVIFSKRIEWRVLQQLVTAQSFGRVLHFKELPASVAFSYLTKYLTKALAAYDYNREHHRRAWSASVRFLPRASYYDGAVEYDLIYQGRLGDRIEWLLRICKMHAQDKRGPPLTS